jgi:hypothetical protein
MGVAWNTSLVSQFRAEKEVASKESQEDQYCKRQGWKHAAGPYVKSGLLHHSWNEAAIAGNKS